MNFLKRWSAKAARSLRRYSGVKQSDLFSVMVRRLGFRDAFREQDYKNFAQEGYQENPYVYAAIKETATAVGSIPPVLYRVNRSGDAVQSALDGRERKHRAGRAGDTLMQRVASGLVDREARQIMNATGAPASIARDFGRKRLVQRGELEPVESHEVLDLLENPNPFQDRSYSQFMEATVTHLEIGGEVLWEPVRGGGIPRELYVHSPENIRMIQGDAQRPIRAIEFWRNSGRVRMPYTPDAPEESEVFFVRYFHPRKPFRGMSPIQAAARSINVNNAGRKWNLSLLQNGAQLSGIITSESPLTDLQQESLARQFKEGYAGADNAGKVISVSGTDGLDWKPTSASPKDMAWGDLNQATAREIAIIYNVPPEILGDSTQKTYNNFKEARKAFYKEKVVPLTNLIYGELNSSLLPAFSDDLFLDYDTSQVEALQEDVNQMHERIREDVKAGLLKINEAREILGREEAEGGDVLLVPGTSVPLSAASGGGGPVEGEEGDESESGALPPLEEEYGGDGVPAEDLSFFDGV